MVPPTVGRPSQLNQIKIVIRGTFLEALLDYSRRLFSSSRQLRSAIALAKVETQSRCILRESPRPPPCYKEVSKAVWCRLQDRGRLLWTPQTGCQSLFLLASQVDLACSCEWMRRGRVEVPIGQLSLQTLVPSDVVPTGALTPPHPGPQGELSLTQAPTSFLLAVQQRAKLMSSSVGQSGVDQSVWCGRRSGLGGE